MNVSHQLNKDQITIQREDDVHHPEIQENKKERESKGK